MDVLFTEVLLLFALAVSMAFVATKLRLPALVSFLLTGVLAGPYGLGIISAVTRWSSWPRLASFCGCSRLGEDQQAPRTGEPDLAARELSTSSDAGGSNSDRRRID